MGELCLVPESFLCLVPDLFRDPGTDSDLESGGVGVERAEAGALTACWGRTGATLNWFNRLNYSSEFPSFTRRQVHRETWRQGQGQGQGLILAVLLVALLSFEFNLIIIIEVFIISVMGLF